MAKTPTDIRSLARAHTATGIKVLAGIMKEKGAPTSARVAAVIALFDRGWGKPHQTSDVTVRQAVARDLSDDELASIATGSGEGVADTPIDPEKLN